MRYTTLPIFCLLLLIFSASTSCANTIVGFLVPSSGLGDQSFNDMTYAGIMQAKTHHDFDLIREQCVDSSEQASRDAMERLISKGSTIIVVNGWEYNELVKEFAIGYPNHRFIINDYPVTDIPNVVSIIYGQHEGSFLAGALAGWMSKTKTIGFIGGMDMPVIQSFKIGFQEGARFANPQITILEVFLSTPESSYSGFDTPGLGQETANYMYDNNADIIFAAAGLSGNGVIQAARLQEKFVIGVDADQDHLAKGYVLTSVMKRLDIATATILNRILSGESLHGVYSFSLKEGGVSLSPMTYTRERVPQEIHNKLAKLQRLIIDGTIIVSNPLVDTTHPTATSIELDQQ